MRRVTTGDGMVVKTSEEKSKHANGLALSTCLRAEGTHHRFLAAFHGITMQKRKLYCLEEPFKIGTFSE